MAKLGIFGEDRPNHVLINEYTPGQGIMVRERERERERELYNYYSHMKMAHSTLPL